MQNALLQIVAWIAVVGFAVFFIFQLSLALGIPLGKLAWGGKYKKLPNKLRVASLFSAGIFAFGILCVLERAGLVTFINRLAVIKLALWFLTVLFGLSVFANIMSTSKWEKRIMTPLAAILCLSCLILALC